MLKPKHLEAVYQPTEKDGREGEIVCECGCDEFSILCFGEWGSFQGDLSLLLTGNGEGTYMQRVDALCTKCGKQWKLYDFALHGYDGFVCEDGIRVPDDKLEEFTTDADTTFNVKMFIEFDDEDQFIEEVVNDEYLQQIHNIMPDDRASIWSSMAMDLKGVQSRKKYNNFINEKLA